MNKSFNAIFAATVAAAILAVLVPAAQAQYAVRDDELISRTGDVASNTGQEVSRLTDILNKDTAINQAVGDAGGQQGIDQMLTGSKNLAGLDIRLPTVQGLSLPSDQNVDSFRSYALSAFWPSSPSQDALPKAAPVNLQARRAALNESIINAYSLAIEAREDAAATPAYAKNLAAMAQNAKTIRQDLAALTTATLASLERLNQLQAVMASMLEIEANHALIESPTVAPPGKTTLFQAASLGSAGQQITSPAGNALIDSAVGVPE